MLSVAVIGSGPAGCYACERLVRSGKAAVVDVIDRLATPFGLVRFGVAPDHQGTKAVNRIFARTLGRSPAAFFGDIYVGRDVSLAELEGLYDAVIIATGAPHGRRLDISGEDLPGVVSSERFVGWYNDAPGVEAAPVDLASVRSVVVIGNGNVALDVARMLAKTPGEFDQSDLHPEVAGVLERSAVREIRIVGRRGAAEARFAPHELSELGELQRAVPCVTATDLPPPAADEAPHIPVLRGYAEASPPAADIEIGFHFHAAPHEFVGRESLEAVRFGRKDGTSFHLPAQLAITCIGYRAVACCHLQPDNGCFANEEGRISERLWAVGWAKRGASGTIPTNRSEAQAVVDKLLAETMPAGRAGRSGLEALLRERSKRWITAEQWQAIDQEEQRRAGTGRVRRKFRNSREIHSFVAVGD